MHDCCAVRMHMPIPTRQDGGEHSQDQLCCLKQCIVDCQLTAVTPGITAAAQHAARPCSMRGLLVQPLQSSTLFLFCLPCSKRRARRRRSPATPRVTTPASPMEVCHHLTRSAGCQSGRGVMQRRSSAGGGTDRYVAGLTMAVAVVFFEGCIRVGCHGVLDWTCISN